MGDIYYWWCPNCKQEVSGSSVTFSEHHSMCGHPVEYVTASDINEITRLQEENKTLTMLLNISPETTKVSSPALAIQTQYETLLIIRQKDEEINKLREEVEKREALLVEYAAALTHSLSVAKEFKEKLSEYLNKVSDHMNGKEFTDDEFEDVEIY